MQLKGTDSYFFRSFIIVLASALLFMFIKRHLPERIFTNAVAGSKNIAVDSMLIDASSDADRSGKQKASAPPVKIEFEDVEGIRFPNEMSDRYQGFQYLVPFFERLASLEETGQGHVRIAYFGDSMTDGDMIVQDFRALLQQRFGGTGVGFVPITSESAGSRSSVTHLFSQNWKTQTFLNVKWPLRSFGINGHVFFANDTAAAAWVSFKAGRRRFTSVLDNPTLYFGSADNKEGIVSVIIGRDTISKKLAANAMLNTISLKSSPKSLKARFIKADSIPVYGFSFDSGLGVNVDSFSQRGNSGIPIINLKAPLMKAFQEKLDYDMIILHYGTNVLNYGTKDFSWYARSMSKAVNHLRDCFPNVPILVISTADKASKYGLEMKTDSAVVPLSNAQRQYAINTKSGFINLYTLMGGDGSITRWTDEEPAMANKDYTHFNFRGSEKVAKLLFDQLMKGYGQYNKLRPGGPVKVKAAIHATPNTKAND